MNQELEITKAKDGTTAEELRFLLKEGSELIGKEYLIRMNNLRVLGDASFVAEIKNSIYLISYYNFEVQRPVNPPPFDSPNMKIYMDKLRPIFEHSETIRLPIANSFWIDSVIKEKVG